MSSQCRGPFTFIEDSAAGIVEEGLQPGSLRRGAPRPDNITVVEEKVTIRREEEKTEKETMKDGKRD